MKIIQPPDGPCSRSVSEEAQNSTEKQKYMPGFVMIEAA